MKVFSGTDQLDEFIIENCNNKAVLLYFGAEWCGPCKQLKKKLDEPETSNTMPKLVVAYIDIDDEENSSLVKSYKVKSLPTQIFIKLDNNKVVEKSRVEGYDIIQLKLKYDEYIEFISKANNY
jgi:thiol-disulfide isomerase/thioredoxin